MPARGIPQVLAQTVQEIADGTRKYAVNVSR
jgi:hypothetical protein